MLAMLSSLRRGSRLQTLSLRGSPLSAPAAAALAETLAYPACPLVTLELGGTGLGVRAVVRIARALRNNTRLRRLALDFNGVGASGARELTESARTGGALHHVSVANAGVGAKWQAALQQQLAANVEASRLS